GSAGSLGLPLKTATGAMDKGTNSGIIIIGGKNSTPSGGLKSVDKVGASPQPLPLGGTALQRVTQQHGLGILATSNLVSDAAKAADKNVPNGLKLDQKLQIQPKLGGPLSSTQLKTGILSNASSKVSRNVAQPGTQTMGLFGLPVPD